MIFKMLGTIALSVIAGIAYRCGGSGHWPRWFRGVGLVICTALELMLLGHIHWTLILCAGLVYGVSTTYFKSKNSSVQWWNWMLVGLAFSIALLPLVIAQGLWLGFAIRTVFCTALIVIWSQSQGNAVLEELGRGFIPIITLPLLLI